MSKLHFLKFGRPGGRPLVVLHGFPGSALQAKVFEPHAEEFGLEIFAPDRPGYGRTPAQKSKGLMHWAALLNGFFIEHRIENAALIGISGGAPYAVAAAAHLPEKIERLGLICGLAPLDGSKAFSAFQKKGLDFYRRAPGLVTGIMVQKFLAKANPERRLNALARVLNPQDRMVLMHEEVRPTLLASMEESRMQGPHGVLNDLYHFSRPWDVDWKKLEAPTWIWHGDDDRLLSPLMAQEMKQRLPHARLKMFEGEGHYSLPILRAREILLEFLGEEKK